jgi:hypothetical protein
MMEKKRLMHVWCVLLFTLWFVSTGSVFGETWTQQNSIDLWKEVRTAVVANDNETFEQLKVPTEELFNFSFSPLSNLFKDSFPEWDLVKLENFEQHEKAALMVLRLPSEDEQAISLAAYKFLLTENGWKISTDIVETRVEGGTTVEEQQQNIKKILEEEIGFQLTPGKRALTKQSMRAVGTALGYYQMDTGSYLEAPEEQNLTSDIIPEDYLLVFADAWGTPFRYVSDGTSYRLISYGADKAKGKAGGDEDADIIYENGDFVSSDK